MIQKVMVKYLKFVYMASTAFRSKAVVLLLFIVVAIGCVFVLGTCFVS